MPVESTTANNSYRLPTSANNGPNFVQGIADLAADVDAMDLAGTLAARPAASKVGRTYYATDNGLFYRDTGTAWVISAGFSSGTVAARPAAGVAGRVYYATDNGLFYQDNGSAWMTALIASAWSNLTFGTGVGSLVGRSTPAARLEGDLVRLRGTLHNTSGASIANGATLFTVAATFQPAAPITLSTLQQGSTSFPYPLVISTGGVAATVNPGDGTFGTGANLSLDGMTYSLS